MVSPFLKQFWVALGVLSNNVGLGMLVAYPSSLLPGLRAPDSPIQVDLDSASFLASCVGVTSCIGFIGTSFLMEVYGRKWAHIMLVVPGLLGWLLISFANNYSMLLVGRLVCGFNIGTTTLGAVSIGEYTGPVSRGLFLNLKTAVLCLGSMTVHVITNFLHWRIVALICLAPQVFTFCNILTWPESPAWLVSKNRFEECERSFLWLRGKSEESQKELTALIKAQKKRADFMTKMSRAQIATNFVKKFKRKDFLLPILIIFFSLVLLEACGRHIFPAYAVQFISNITGDHSQAFLYTLSMDLIITVSATLSCAFIKKMPRRSVLFYSGISSMIVLLAVSVYLFLSSKGIVANDKPWIPCSMLVLYLVLCNIGCTSIPLILLGEIFPLPHRGAGSAMAGLILSFALTLFLQMTPKFIDAINVHGTFTVLALVMAFSLLVLYFTLPETKDKTLQEIEDYFNYGHFLDDKTEFDDDELQKKILQTEPEQTVIKSNNEINVLGNNLVRADQISIR